MVYSSDGIKLSMVYSSDLKIPFFGNLKFHTQKQSDASLLAYKVLKRFRSRMGSKGAF